MKTISKEFFYGSVHKQAKKRTRMCRILLYRSPAFSITNIHSSSTSSDVGHTDFGEVENGCNLRSKHYDVVHESTDDIRSLSLQSERTMTTASNGNIIASVKPFLPPWFSHGINMLSVVLLFGLINTVNGNSTLPSPNNSTPMAPSSADGPRKNISATTASALYKKSTSTTNTYKTSLRHSSSLATTLPVLATTSIAKLQTAMGTQNTSTQLPPILTQSLTTTITSRAMTSSQELTEGTKSKNSVKPTTATSSIHVSSKTTSLTRTAFSTTTRLSSNPPKTSVQSTTTRSTPSEKAKDKEKILWFHVTIGTLKNMLYATAGIALLCIILLIIVCCCWRRQMRKARKLKKENTTLSNPYVNHHQVLGFPSPLQLDTFVTKPESPYDMPERVEAPSDDPEVSYITVVDSNESDSDYAAVKKNGTANSVADNESRDEELPQSPEYTNASVFQDPYEQLKPNNRGKEHHYTSLINSDKTKEENEATV